LGFQQGRSANKIGVGTHYKKAISKQLTTHFKAKREKGVAVAYAENFHGGFHSVACGGHLFVVCGLCDVTL